MSADASIPPVARGSRPLGAWAPLLILGSLLALLFLGMGRLPQRLEAHPEAYVPVYFAAFGAYLLAAAYLWRQRDSRASLVILIGFAVLFRLIDVMQPPSLSTDIWRYVWDGHVGAQGINPYRYPPSDPALIPYRTAYWRIINHPTWVTMYPPLSQRIFTFVAWLGGTSPLTFKALFALVDMADVGLLLILLRRAALPLNRIVFYAWHPLVVMELSGSGHQDVLGIFFMLVAIALLAKGRTPREGILGGIGAGLSVMAKGYLLPALPIFARKRPILFGLAFGITVAALLLPYMEHGSQILDGMRRYLQYHRNAGVSAWTGAFLAHFMPRTAAEALGRKLMAVVVLLTVGWLTWRPWADEADLMRRSTAAMGVFFLLSSTVYPWYATWLVPGFCMMKSRRDAGAMGCWILWSGLIALAYLNPLPGENPWVPQAEYPPVLAWAAGFWLLDLYARRDIIRKRHQP